MEEYTGRQIAIFADIHGLLEPAVAVLEDIKRRGITEIYSLGDNIGTGPKPKEVLELLIEHNVHLINGNSEEYAALGIEPFDFYFTERKRRSAAWTLAQLTEEQIELLKHNKHSFDLYVGNKKIGLCHFANDVRVDHGDYGVGNYTRAMKNGFEESGRQFYRTNSEIQKMELERMLKDDRPENRGYLSAKEDPIFEGKQVDYYDEIIQGHAHFRYLTDDGKIRVRTIRALGIGYDKDPVNTASYIIIKERIDGGYDIEEVLVPYEREKMLESIDRSTMPDKETIETYVQKR